ncbi:MAG: hypothetical protein MUO39_11350, partial [Steroidobacteraceae bacterium]|nr:hypothetical protein [Steroidobacteraceae bacterium]
MSMRLPRFSFWSTLVLCAGLLAGPPAVWADDAACTKCHEDVTFKSAAHPELGCVDCHTNITSTPHDALPDDQKLTG